MKIVELRTLLKLFLSGGGLVRTAEATILPFEKKTLVMKITGTVMSAHLCKTRSYVHIPYDNCLKKISGIVYAVRRCGNISKAETRKDCLGHFITA